MEQSGRASREGRAGDVEDIGGLDEGASTATDEDDIDVVLDLRDGSVPTGRRRVRWRRRRPEAKIPGAAPMPRPDARRYSGPDDIASIVCEWMRYLGFGPCRGRADTDGGPELVTDRGFAVILGAPRPVGVDAVRRVHASATEAGKHPVVFAPLGFTEDAVEWADRHPTALVAYGLRAEMTAVNHIARRLISGADRRAGRPPG